MERKRVSENGREPRRCEEFDLDILTLLPRQKNVLKGPHEMVEQPREMFAEEALELRRALPRQREAVGVQPPQPEVAQERDEHPKRLLLGHVHEQHGGDEGHALRVAELLVVHGVRLEHVVQLALALALLVSEVLVLREGAVEVLHDLLVLLRRADEDEPLLCYGAAEGGGA